MRCLEIVLIIGFLLSDNGAQGMQLQWDVRQSRKLLLAGGTPVTDKGKSMFIVKTEQGTMTGIALKNKIIALPGTIVHPKVGEKMLERKSNHDGWTFWTFPDASTPMGDYYTGDAAPKGTCEIFGVNNNVSVRITSKTTNGLNVEGISNKICSLEVGGALICEDKVVGLVHHLISPEPRAIAESATEEISTTTESTSTFTTSIKEIITTHQITLIIDDPESTENTSAPIKERKKRDANEQVCSLKCQVTPISIIIKPEPSPKMPDVMRRNQNLSTEVPSANKERHYVVDEPEVRSAGTIITMTKLLSFVIISNFAGYF